MSAYDRYHHKSYDRYFPKSHTGSTLALALPEPAPGPAAGQTPAQRQLRQMVVDSVQAPTSKLAYGHALDQLLAFAAGRPLTRI